LLILSAILLTAFANASPVCLAPAKARANLVYLHGLDDPDPSKEEQGYISDLKHLSTELQMGLYAERSKVTCPSKKLCWRYRDPAELAATLQTVSAGAKTCFKDTPVPLFVLGYSNGGYFATRLVATCTPHPFAAIVASGSSGDLDPKIKDFASCGRLRLVIGKNDKLTRPKTLKLHAELKQKNGDVTLSEFDGGHRLDFPTLRSVFLELLAQNPPKR
jgi:hypothetical protein